MVEEWRGGRRPLGERTLPRESSSTIEKLSISGGVTADVISVRGLTASTPARGSGTKSLEKNDRDKRTIFVQQISLSHSNVTPLTKMNHNY
jgi:hypothetical protein